MRKHKSKLVQPKFATQSTQPLMSPWEIGEDPVLVGYATEIPTYRKEVVESFLGKMHARTSQPGIHAQDEPRQIKTIKKSAATVQLRSQKVKTVQYSDEDQPKHRQSIFRQQPAKQQKTKLRANIVTLQVDVQCSQDSRKPKNARQPQIEASKTFTKKLKLKQLICNKKNIESMNNKFRPKSYSCLEKRPSIGHDFAQLDVVAVARSIFSPSIAYRRASRLKKRPQSEQNTRQHSFNVVF